jgi:dTDP-4-amino-4,6-dideoxygalactose transaminase
MIKLFHIENHKINTAKFNHFLHGDIVKEVEESITEYVGAKYGCAMNSATNAIFLSLLNIKVPSIKVPSIIPPVVLNAILTTGNKIEFVDNVDWIGGSYVLHDFGHYKIIDSAQKLEKNQFKNEANNNDLMIFSFYPTKPIGGMDGGLVVSNDYDKIKWFREASFNGMSFAENNWERKIKFPGWKMYMNSAQAYVIKQNFMRLGHKESILETIKVIYNSSFGVKNTSNHLYRINVENRDEVIKKFKENKISYGIHYAAQHLNSVYNKKKIYLPKSTKESETTLSIPFHEKLKPEEIKKIIGVVNGA